MPGWRACGSVLLLLAAVLSGCLDARPDVGLPDGAGPPAIQVAPRFVGTCDNALLFQFVDYAATDPFLPPGFHPSDASNFLPIPAAFGQAAVVAMVLGCPGGPEAYEAGIVGIFVHAPAVDGLADARFNFYELERYGPLAGPFVPVLQEAGWPLRPGHVFVRPQNDAIEQFDFISANITDEAGSVLAFDGVTAVQLPLGQADVRFWHDGPRGLAYIEYNTTLDSVVGAGTCSARAGTAMGVFLGSGLAATGPGCPPGDPIIAVFPQLHINATARFLPGVHAG